MRVGRLPLRNRVVSVLTVDDGIYRPSFSDISLYCSNFYYFQYSCMSFCQLLSYIITIASSLRRPSCISMRYACSLLKKFGTVSHIIPQQTDLKKIILFQYLTVLKIAVFSGIIKARIFFDSTWYFNYTHL